MGSPQGANTQQQVAFRRIIHDLSGAGARVTSVRAYQNVRTINNADG
jgi:hypothetical protein